ncbi:MAG TPA: dTDP-4-dehydrorhamnose reductase, partial [Novimethylophilus sp.]|uniref:dTDP-4-dehydrorhamnose reductase n=1 Tax=Novimethylophilus sp. TaxID=2137426 RepID=UPI002F3E56D3
ALREIRPHLIVNPAAYTAVDRAENEPELAMAINGVAPGILAEEAKRMHAMLVHYSTDYVFDGAKPGPYRENDPTNPASSYGRSKLAGEEAIRAVDVPHLILRTSWVYGARGRNFMLTILRLANERHALDVVDDQLGSPTWSRMIAEVSALMLAGGDLEALSGTYHLSCAGSASWYGVARAILEEYRARREARGWPVLRLQLQNIAPITTDQYPTAAKRPANSILDNGKLARTFGLELPEWRECLGMVLDEAATVAL